MPGKAKPKWEPGQDYRSGLKAYELAQEFKTELEPRLSSGLLQGLKEDLEALSKAGDEGQAKVVEIKGFTGTQDAHSAQALRWSSAVREALKRGGVDADVKKAAGVGSRFTASRVDAVIAAVNSILRAYEKHPDAFRASGVLPEDIEAGKRLLVSLNAADLVQETAKAKKTQSTAARRALRNRVESAVDRIRGAGMLHFHGKPAVAARFAALVPGKGGGATKPAEPEAAKTN